MNKISSLILLLTLCLFSTNAFGQVGTWPAQSTYVYFGANELGQSTPGNYALLQDKSNGTTLLNSPLDIYFRIGNTQKMYLSNAGNLGIGTTTPYQWSRLHVKAPGANPWGFLVEANSNDRIIGMSHNGSSGVIATSFLGSGGHSPLQFVTSDVTRMWIDASGNIGVGTTVPDQKLDVRGNMVLETGMSPVVYTGIGTSELNRYLLLANSANFGSASGLKAGGVLVSDSYAYANPGKNDLIVKGNVGIGTNTPGNFKLAVNGKIWGTEVQVALTNPGPDYVFEKSYALPSLEEVKFYIDQNKHLPEVPSAKEMKMNGVNVGEMNILLLKKIEELTLYVIELNDRLDKQNDLIKKQPK
jgi:hypothetical protein